MKQGDIPAAREQAREAFRKNRLSVDSWKLMYCAMRGKVSPRRNLKDSFEIGHLSFG